MIRYQSGFEDLFKKYGKCNHVVCWGLLLEQWNGNIG